MVPVQLLLLLTGKVHTAQEQPCGYPRKYVVAISFPGNVLVVSCSCSLAEACKFLLLLPARQLRWCRQRKLATAIFTVATLSSMLCDSSVHSCLEQPENFESSDIQTSPLKARPLLPICLQPQASKLNILAGKCCLME